MRATVRRVAVAAIAALVAVSAGCGGGDGSADGGGRLKVSAAASLRTAFTAYGDDLPDPSSPAFSFAGSDILAAQIEQGARPDVYAAANDTLPARLHAAGLLERPVVFATNELVVAVRADRRDIHDIADLARDGIAVAIGAPSVPVGAYTATVLARLPARVRAGVERHVRSTEPDVAGIVGKVTQGAVDAGVVYRSDVRASDGRLRAVALPATLRPRVRYAAGVVVGSPHRAAARHFVYGLLGPAGRRALIAAGFGPPPGP